LTDYSTGSLNSMKKKSMFMNMGTAIGLCAALGILLGALLQNVAMWLCIGAGAGTVLGAILAVKTTQGR